MRKEKVWERYKKEQQSADVKQVTKRAGVPVAVVRGAFAGFDTLPGDEFLLWMIEELADTKSGKTCWENKDGFETMFR